MYRVERTCALPPHTERLPRKLPLSRLCGATPTREAICLRLRRPSSGSSTNSTLEATGPTPGTLRSRSSLTRHMELDWMRSPRSLSRSLSCARSQAMCCSICLWTYTVAFERRLRSAAIIPTICRRRAMSPRSSFSPQPPWQFALHRRFHGLTESGQHHRIYRVRLGQPARGPGELTRLSWVDHHNWEPCGGQLATTSDSYPPEASITISAGERASTRLLNAETPSASLATSHTSPVGQTPTTKSEDDTSTPMNLLSASIHLTIAFKIGALPLAQPCTSGLLGPINCSGSVGSQGRDDHAHPRSPRPRGNRPVTPHHLKDTRGIMQRSPRTGVCLGGSRRRYSSSSWRRPNWIRVYASAYIIP